MTILLLVGALGLWFLAGVLTSRSRENSMWAMSAIGCLLIGTGWFLIALGSIGI